MDIPTLAATIRAGLGDDWFSAMAVTEHLIDGGETGIDAYALPEAVRRSVFRWTPHRVQAEVAAKRQLLNLLLAEPHWAICEAKLGSDPCDCGRDERVTACLTVLAAPYSET